MGASVDRYAITMGAAVWVEVKMKIETVNGMGDDFKINNAFCRQENEYGVALQLYIYIYVYNRERFGTQMYT